MGMSNDYCRLLQSLIRNSGFSQRAIARKAGITSGYLCRISSGQEPPATPETNTAIARACGASQQEIAELTFLAASQRHPDLLAVVERARLHIAECTAHFVSFHNFGAANFIKNILFCLGIVMDVLVWNTYVLAAYYCRTTSKLL